MRTSGYAKAAFLTMAAAGWCWAASASAAPPALSLDVSLIDNGATLWVVITPSAPAVDCSYVLWGAPKKKDVNPAHIYATLLASLPGRATGTVLQAQDLPLVKKKDKSGNPNKVKTFFMVQIQCGDEVASSPAVMLKLQTKKKGAKNAAAWLEKVAAALKELLPD